MPKLSAEVQTQRRENILDAAEQCFSRRGFHGTTMQDICRAAQVSAGAVYVYFSSKEALIAGIVQRDRDSIQQQLAAVAEAPDVLDGLRQVMRECVLGQPPHKPALFIEIGAEATRNPFVARVLNDCDLTLRRALEQSLHRAAARGQISAAIDARKASLVMAMLADAMFMRRATDPAFAPDEIAPVVLEIVASLLGLEADVAPVAAASRPVQPFLGVAE